MRVAILGSQHGLAEVVFHLLTGQKPGQAPKGYVSAIATGCFPDERLRALAEAIKPEKTTPDRSEFHMFLGMGPLWSDKKAGEIFGALAPYDAFVVVAESVAEFEDLYDRVILSDSEAADNLLPKVKKSVSGGHEDPKKLAILEMLSDALGRGKPIFSIGLLDQDLRLIHEYGFLSLKPAVAALLKEPETALPVDWVAGDFRLALELASLPDDERDGMAKELGIGDLAYEILSKLYRASGLIHFFTPGPKEVKSWSLRKGASALEAAGRIHSDMERGFIRAMVARWDAVVSAGGWESAKKTGIVKKEGKDYIIQDGDVIEVLFSR
ncbi:MAG: DUF933 domain-containing protein [candidate division WOR-3 bacterium]